ncbi:MAG: nicotinate-nucleotide adenylyltransferase [Chloroflexi bacterium]|nr:nicotinate-nucleotide adenylyltransferase [Chloroflexota bacterium]
MSEAGARLGLLGGTFDPIHYGHLVAAEESLYRLRLDRVLLVPAGQPPHKLGRRVTPAAQRLAMVRLAAADNAALAVSTIELERHGPSYSVDTVAAVREQAGPGAEIFFIVGSDALPDLLTWYRPRRLLQLSTLAVVSRPGYPFDLSHLSASLPEAAQRIVHVPAPELAISSSDLRARVAAGRPIRYQLPEAVELYIRQQGLYIQSP